jgi:hypothetical protein
MKHIAEEILAQRHWMKSELEQLNGFRMDRVPIKSSKPWALLGHVFKTGLPVTEPGSSQSEN